MKDTKKMTAHDVRDA